MGNDIDATMLNTLVPFNSNNMNNSSGLMNATQMAQSLGSLANLSKLNNQQSYSDNIANSEIMSQHLPTISNQYNQHLPTISNQYNQNPMNINAIKNLAALNSIKMI